MTKPQPIEYTRECTSCRVVETITEDTRSWTTERWNEFQRNLHAPWMCKKCCENQYGWE